MVHSKKGVNLTHYLRLACTIVLTQIHGKAVNNVRRNEFGFELAKELLKDARDCVNVFRFDHGIFVRFFTIVYLKQPQN